MACGSAYESLRYRLHWRLANTSWNFKSRCLKSISLPQLSILSCHMTCQRWIFFKTAPFDASRTLLSMNNTCRQPVVRWDWAKMATGKMSFNYYQNGKYGSLPQNPQKDMEVTQDMHLKMSKKIAQLTKVSWCVFNHQTYCKESKLITLSCCLRCLELQNCWGLNVELPI